MSKRSGLLSAFAASLCVFVSIASAQAQAPSQAKAESGASGAASAPAKLTEEEQRLVASSRSAIIATGLSAPYFDRHFTLAQVVNTTGDRRVVWRLRAGEHEALVIDAVGFYTDEKGRRVNTHSVTGKLGAAREIRRTITRRRAEQLMRACIGPFDGGAVLYQTGGNPPRAALYFSATSALEPVAPSASQLRTAASGQSAAPSPQGQTPATVPPAPQQGDRLGGGGKKPPPPLIGFVDLQTGRCTAGYGLAGAYPPLPPPRPPQKRRN